MFLKEQGAFLFAMLTAVLALGADAPLAEQPPAAPPINSEGQVEAPVPPKDARSWRLSDQTYQVRYLPTAKIRVDGRADEPEWSQAAVEQRFLFPWKQAAAPPTSIVTYPLLTLNDWNSGAEGVGPVTTLELAKVEFDAMFWLVAHSQLDERATEEMRTSSNRAFR